MKRFYQKLNPDFRSFVKYSVPATVTMLLAGIYTVVDGLFVGWGAGDDALAAINVAFPFYCFFLGLGEMLGNGTSITIAYCRGRNKPLTAGLFFGNLISLMIPLGVLLTLGAPFYSKLVVFMGADKSISAMAETYAVIISMGCVFQIVTSSLLAVMRHDKAQFSAMSIMIVGVLMNILLDYLLVIVWPFGVRGSAWATVVSQFTTSILAVLFFTSGRYHFAFRMRHLRPYASILGRIMRIGLPSFGLQMMGAILILLHNIQAQRYGGLTAVAAYAIISYVMTPVMMLSEGIGLGIQPPVSYHHGLENEEKKGAFLYYGVNSAVWVGALSTIILLAGYNVIPSMFNATPGLVKVTMPALIITALSFIPLCVFHVFCAYFQAEGRSVLASALIYGDFCVMFPVALFILPHFYGLAGVWAAVPAAKLIMFAIALFTYRYLKSKRRILSMKAVS